jgi:hypothetical protein
MLQAQKQEQEIIDREKMRKERPTETLVKNTFSGGAIEAEVLEIEGFISIISLALFSSTTLIFSLLIDNKFSSS